jgi:carboxylesterase type B
MEDVIVVTINYRLNFLGFACVPEMGIYGNAAMKDQQMALEWVHENIGYFGGDKDNVTLFGSSAGATSTHLHSLNQKSRKYFHKMILQSGNALCDWAIQMRPEEKTNRALQMMKCRTNSPKDIYESLMNSDAKQLCSLNLKCGEEYEKRRKIPFFVKTSVEVENDEAFLTKMPFDIIREKQFDLSMPMIIGINNGDGLVQAERLLKDIEKIKHTISDLIPPMLNVEYGSKEYYDFGNVMSNFYFGDEGLTAENSHSLPHISTDTHFLIPVLMTNEIYKNLYPKTKTFMYEFGLESRLNYFKSIMKTVKHFPGCSHGDEVSYLFK